MQTITAVFLLCVFVATAQKTIEQIEGVTEEVTFMVASADGRVHLATTNKTHQTYHCYQKDGGFIRKVSTTQEITSLVVDHTGNAYFTVEHISDYILIFWGAESTEWEQWGGEGYTYETDIILIVDKENYVYLADGDGVFILRGNNTRSKISGVQRRVRNFIEDSQGNLYLDHGKEVLDQQVAVIYPTEKDRPTPAARKVNGISDSYVEPIADIAIDSQDNIFFGIVGSKTSLKKLTAEGSIQTLLPFAINKVAVDKKDLVYATTWSYMKDRNLFAIPAGSSFPMLVLGLADNTKDFLDIKIDNANNAYIATAETNLYLLPGGDLGNVTIVQGIPNSQPFQAMLLDQDDNLIVLLEDLFVVPAGATKATRVLGLPAGNKQMVLGADNSVYFGTAEGLYRYA